MYENNKGVEYTVWLRRHWPCLGRLPPRYARSLCSLISNWHNFKSSFFFILFISYLSNYLRLLTLFFFLHDHVFDLENKQWLIFIVWNARILFLKLKEMSLSWREDFWKLKKRFGSRNIWLWWLFLAWRTFDRWKRFLANDSCSIQLFLKD